MGYSQVNESLLCLIDSLGEEKFSQRLLNYINTACHVDHVSIFISDHQLIPRLVSSRSLDGKSLARRAGQVYTTKLFYQHDPNAIHVIDSHEEGDTVSMSRMRAADIPDLEYKTAIYDRFKLIDRVSLLTQLEQHWFAINVYRDRVAAEFSSTDLDSLGRLSKTVITVVKKHFTLLPSSVWKAPSLPDHETLLHLIQGLDGQLSQREMEVCSYALLGVTNEGIALRLDVQMNTIATLRKRAFAKLNISSINQLYGLCLAKVIELKKI